MADGLLRIGILGAAGVAPTAVIKPAKENAEVVVAAVAAAAALLLVSASCVLLAQALEQTDRKSVV